MGELLTLEVKKCSLFKAITMGHSPLLLGETERLKGVLLMNEPITTLDTRYSEPDGVVTSWEQTRRVLETAELFWLSTVRTDGRPHVTPAVAVWRDGTIHFNSAGTSQQRITLR